CAARARFRPGRRRRFVEASLYPSGTEFLTDPGLQHALYDLPRRRHRHLVDDEQALRPAHLRDATRAEKRAQFVEFDPGARLQGQAGADAFTENVIRHRNDSGHDNGIVLDDGILDIGWIDLYPAAVDQILHPAGDGDVPLVVPDGEVAGPEPSVTGEGGRIGCIILHVARQNREAAELKFALLRVGDRSTVGGHNARFHARNGTTDGPMANIGPF